MAAKTDLSERQIRLALAYGARFPDEIDDAVARGRRPLEELRADFPTVVVVSIPNR